MPLRRTKKNDKIKQGYKFLALPNKDQEVKFSKTFGCVRKYWNIAKSDSIENYKNNKTFVINSPHFYKEKEEYSYLKEVDSLALCNAQTNLNTAYTNFFQKKGGYPSFKSKSDKQSYTTNNQISKNGIHSIYLIRENGKDYIKLPKIGLVEIKRHRKVTGLIKNVTITKAKSGKYYVSIMCEQEVKLPDIKIDASSIDALDYKSDGLYTDINGCCDMPHFYKVSQKDLVKYQKQLSKKVKGSNNYKKQKSRLAKFSEYVSNQRKDFLHKQSTKITNLYDIVVVEDINLKEIASSKSKYHLGKATNDNGYGMFISMLEYKLQRKGGILIKADKFYPSSQLCSSCNFQNKDIKNLSIRKWTCPCCGTQHDRDENAVKNLINYGHNYIKDKY